MLRLERLEELSNLRHLCELMNVQFFVPYSFSIVLSHLSLQVVAQVEHGHDAGVLCVSVQATLRQQLLHWLVNTTQLLPTLHHAK